MKATLTESQAELLHLLYTNINNANAYCESLLSDDSLLKGIKESSIRPIYVKVSYLKKALELKMPKGLDKEKKERFEDTLVYDEVARLMAYMSADNRLAVEEFAKSLVSE